jgi:glycosyltransferase involved in cell wall biosynthesis
VVIGIDASRLSEAVLTGTERYTREMITALVRRYPGHRFLLYARPGTAPLPLPDDVASRVVLRRIGPPRLWTHAGLGRELKLRPPDAVFIPAHVLPLPQVFGSRLRAVVTIHDAGYRRFPEAHPLRQRLYLELGTAFTARCASALVVDSEATRADVRRYYGVAEDRIRVAYPGMLPLADVIERDRCSVLRRFGLEPGQPYALFVGTLQPRKNLRRLLQAWRWVVDQAPSVERSRLRLVLAGGQGWGGEDLHGLAERLGLAKAVVWTGYVTDVDKSALMHEARALAFPSLYEGFGLPVLEAQSAGLPVVTSATSSLPEAAGDAALLVDPLDEGAIGRALRDALWDAPLRARLIEAGRRNVRRFRWEDAAEVVMELLRA